MTEAEFKSLKRGDVIRNELGWQYVVIKRIAEGWSLRLVPGTGRNLEMQSSSKTGRAITARAWSRV